MWKIKTCQLLAGFFMVIFALSVLLGLMGLAAAKTAGTAGDAGNWKLYNSNMNMGEMCLIIAAIGLAVSWPLGSLFDKKARNLLEKEYAKKHPYPDRDSDRPIPPMEPLEPYDPTPRAPRDKPLGSKG